MVAQIPGLEALQRHLFGRQAAFATPIAAKRAYPLGGRPDINVNWVLPEGDLGSVDPIAAPYRGIPEYTATTTADPLYYNDIPLFICGVFGGNDTPAGAGTAKTWTTVPASLTADDIDVFTYMFGNDVASDWFMLSDGVVESVTFTFPRGLGPVTVSANWRFGSAYYEGATEVELQPSITVPTAGLSVSATDIPAYVGDAELFIDSTAAGIGGTKISNAMYGGSVTISRELDRKYFVNGDGFTLSGYSSGARTINWNLEAAPTASIVGAGSETDAWFSSAAVNRYVELKFTSTSEAQAATPYSWSLRLPLRWFTRGWDAEGQNTVITLGGQQFYDTTTTYAFRSVVVNQLASTGL